MAAPSRRRIPTVDIVRGVFMAAIICTHTLSNVSPQAMKTLLECARALLSGTVGFVTMSGMLVGYFVATRADDLPRVFHRYKVRAALLLLFAHPAISIAQYGPLGGSASFVEFATRSVFVTDVLAVLFLVLVPRTPALAPSLRLKLGVALIVIGRALLLVPTPNRPLLLLREILAGIDTPGPSVLLSGYPLVPVTGIFLVGTWIGHRFAVAEGAATLPALRRRFIGAAAALLASSLLMCAVWAALKWHFAHLDAPVLRKVFYPDYYFATYPGFLGATLLLVAVFLDRTALPRLDRFFLMFGRTSLFTYVLQYYVVQTLPWALRWRHRMTPWQAVAYFAVALPVINVAATFYARVKNGGVSRTFAGVSPG